MTENKFLTSLQRTDIKPGPKIQPKKMPIGPIEVLWAGVIVDNP